MPVEDRHSHRSSTTPTDELTQLRTSHDALRKELKTADREIRNQSLELRDIKKTAAATHEKNSLLREQNAQLREALRLRGEKISRGEKAKYIEHFDMMETHIQHLQYERNKRESHMEFLTEQTREANESKGSIESECRRLQRQVRELSEHLTECKDDLLRLQPTSQVPDNELADLYSNLDQQITGWVDDRTEDSEVLEEQFENIKAPEDLPDLFIGYLSSDQLRMARKYPESQPTVLRYLIHQVLDTFVFDSEIYLFGLDAHNISLLRSLEEGMTLLEPRRGESRSHFFFLPLLPPLEEPLSSPPVQNPDTVTIYRWRSETLSSLLKIPSFQAQQTHQAQLLSQTLQSALSPLITSSQEPSEAGWEVLHTAIVLPALHLSTSLRLSTATYRLLAHTSPPLPNSSQRPTIHTYTIPKATLIDISSHKILRPDSLLKVNADGRIGEEILVIAPALLRIQQSDGESKRERGVVVCKPTVLVKLDEPMGKRSRAINKALGAWTPSWFGGDGEAAGAG